MKFKTMVLIAVGFGLYSLSRSLELRGDMAPLAASGVSPERLTWHLMALALLLAGLGCFIFAGLSAFRGIRDRLGE
jgi:lipopolysaccharide export LptBFGC system permease protein LptF